jgi:hypothetical protein
LQVSAGRLEKPEATHPGDARRLTTSVSHTVLFQGGMWASTGVWGRHYKEVTDGYLEGILGETLLHFGRRHWLTARWEKVEKDELFPHIDPPIVIRPAPPFRSFDVQALTLGYTFDVIRRATWSGGVGVNYTLHQIPASLEPFYGESPRGTSLFIRVRPTIGMQQQHHHH